MDLLQNTVERLLGEHCAREVLLAAESGEFPAALWRAIEEAGLSSALLPEERGGAALPVADALSMLRVAARFSAPVPIAETLLASWLLAGAGMETPPGPLSIAPVNRRDRPTLERRAGKWRLTGRAARVPWARDAAAVAVLTEAGGAAMVARVDPGQATLSRDTSIAGEPRDHLDLAVDLADEAVAPAAPGIGREQLQAMGAAMRTMQIAGALAHVLEITTRYAQERVQFGRPIGKFQAVQQNLAVLAGQAAAAGAAADLASEAAGSDLSLLVIGAAKIRAGEAASAGAAIAHQVHGAIGFTKEHMLNFSTRRLWSLRDEFGNEAEWSRLVGEAALEAGPGRLWAAITAA